MILSANSRASMCNCVCIPTLGPFGLEMKFIKIEDIVKGFK